MNARIRDRASLVIALSAHALAFTWASAPWRGSPHASTPGPVVAIETDIEVDPLAREDAPLPSFPLKPEPTTAPSHDRPRAAAAAHGRSPTSDGPAAPVLESAAPGASGSWTFDATRGFAPTRPSEAGGVTGDASARAFQAASAAVVAAVLAEANRKAADRERRPRTFTSREMELGLVPGNQYVVITRDRVRSSLIPMNGHALLEFWTDSKGIVARVRVVNPSSDPGAWHEMAKALEEDARSTPPLKIPTNADGFIITLDVTSVLRTLTGETPSPGGVAGALRAITNPADAVIDAKTSPRRVVTAKVAGVEAF